MNTTKGHRPFWIVTACMAALALVALALDHWLHVFGVLPYLILLACPLMHLLHRGHRGHSPAPLPGGGPPPTLESDRFREGDEP